MKIFIQCQSCAILTRLARLLRYLKPLFGEIAFFDAHRNGFFGTYCLFNKNCDKGYVAVQL